MDWLREKLQETSLFLMGKIMVSCPLNQCSEITIVAKSSSNGLYPRSHNGVIKRCCLENTLHGGLVAGKIMELNVLLHFQIWLAVGMLNIVIVAACMPGHAYQVISDFNVSLLYKSQELTFPVRRYHITLWFPSASMVLHRRPTDFDEGMWRSKFTQIWARRSSFRRNEVQSSAGFVWTYDRIWYTNGSPRSTGVAPAILRQSQRGEFLHRFSHLIFWWKNAMLSGQACGLQQRTVC